MKLPSFDYQAPASLAEAVALLAAGDGSARPIAGGQSFLPVMAFRLAEPSLLVDLRNIPDLSGIQISDAGVRIGAMTRWRDLLDDTRLRRVQRADAGQPNPQRPALLRGRRRVSPTRLVARLLARPAARAIRQHRQRGNHRHDSTHTSR